MNIRTPIGFAFAVPQDGGFSLWTVGDDGKVSLFGLATADLPAVADVLLAHNEAAGYVNIDTSDIPEAGEEFFDKATLRRLK